MATNTTNQIQKQYKHDVRISQHGFHLFFARILYKSTIFTLIFDNITVHKFVICDHGKTSKDITYKIHSRDLKKTKGIGKSKYKKTRPKRSKRRRDSGQTDWPADQLT